MSRKAARPSLRYEHNRERPASRRQREQRERPWLVALVVLPVATGVVAVMALVGKAWGPAAWGDLAPEWPGQGYGFSLTLGVLEALAAGACIAPLARARRKGNKLRSAAWGAAALPGAVAFGLVAAVALAGMRPKKRHRSGGCHLEGHPCWVHEHYPYAWLVGLVAFAAVGLALLFTIGIRADQRTKAPAPTAT
ncbi:hypothetical protein [Streptomyces justiciae]|uniref:hypothetical protein n=1 Tax=Streptomyces justiciae TaxID=2780140 RepID=UPI001882B166|nr:hypothetical protein [Streptomyces justiciae]MBE8477017.1 hypothetical protein [Streptomyces justiciae]